jgi:hypothetical protein
MYTPKPVDTKKIHLPESLLELTEKIAENAHENWAANRMKEGWIYGPERNDGDKTHPCLIPYEDLPESEKEYDRQTALETLKVITAMGYEIRPERSGDA